MVERPYHAEFYGDLWVEIYASRELQYHKLMVKARIVERPFIKLARRTATPPLNY
jgi:aminomethyltransferase